MKTLRILLIVLLAVLGTSSILQAMDSSTIEECKGDSVIIVLNSNYDFGTLHGRLLDCFTTQDKSGKQIFNLVLLSTTGELQVIDVADICYFTNNSEAYALIGATYEFTPVPLETSGNKE